MYYVSSVAYSNLSIEEVIRSVRKNGWALEFSSGLPFRSDMTEVYLDCDVERMPHNYFPAPNTPFVLNLASTDETIRNLSIEHCLQGLRLAKHSNSPFFAAHAGFCIDPAADELGHRLTVRSYNRESNWRCFVESVSQVLIVASELEIDFLLENNVIAKFNMVKNENPLFCCTSEDIRAIFTELYHPRLGLLLDTAHLKVSCMTLDLDLISEYRSIVPFIRGIHHSDNDGLADSNQRLDNQYWFLPFAADFKDLPQVLEVKGITEEQISHQLALLQNYGH